LHSDRHGKSHIAPGWFAALVSGRYSVKQFNPDSGRWQRKWDVEGDTFRLSAIEWIDRVYLLERR